MLTIPTPDGFTHALTLGETLGAFVYARGDDLVFPELDERSRSRVEMAMTEHVPPPATSSLADDVDALREEVRGIRERAAAAVVTSADAKAVRDAVAGPT